MEKHRKFGGVNHHGHAGHGRGLASHIMRHKGMTPAGYEASPEDEAADRAGMRAANAAPPPEPGPPPSPVGPAPAPDPDFAPSGGGSPVPPYQQA